jgi:hypothetical protein
MKNLLQAFWAVLLLPVASFCLFGFLASFEPGDRHLAWRFGYGLVGIGSLTVGLGFAWRLWKHKPE